MGMGTIPSVIGFRSLMLSADTDFSSFSALR
jgi:hypothetical protein